MAEYVLKRGEDHADVARRLIAEVDDPQAVVWLPRPDVYGGGVYSVRDERAVAKVARDLQQDRDDEEQRIAEAMRLADERDARADETGMTPTELGFPASLPPVVEDDEEADEEADTDKPVFDDPATAEDESAMTPAQRRRAARKAKAPEAAAEPPVVSTEDASEEAK